MINPEEQQILNLKVKYEDAIYGITMYQEKLLGLKKVQKENFEAFKQGTIDGTEYNNTLMSIGEQAKSYKSAIRELSREVQNNIKVEREQEGSLKALRAELANAQKAYAALSREEREGAKGKEMEKHINNIAKEVTAAEEKIGLFQRQVGNYENAIKSALGVNSNFANSLINLSSGGAGVKGVIEGAIASTKAFGSTLLGFMANPVFLSLAGIAGAGVAFKWFFDYNKGIEESTRLTKEFLGLTGDSLREVRNEIQATADTYGKDYKETLEAVDILTSQYGYTAGEALKIINDGFQSGADLNGDMIEKIKQYAPAFRDANISGRELVATIQQTRSGIFSDSGMALIQMGSKKIREMSDSTAEALEGIGINAKKVEKDLTSGAMSTVDVIKLVSTKLKEVPQNSKEVGAVLKDVFGRQGANAGLKMIEHLDTMNVDLEKLKGTTGEYGEKLDEQREANEELNRVLSAMFDMSEKGFGEMLVQVKTLTIQGVTKLIKGLISAINYIIDMYNNAILFRGGVQAVIVTFKELWNVVKLAFNFIIDAAKGVAKTIGGLGEVLEGIVTLSFDKIKKGLNTITNGVVGTFKEGFNDFKGYAKDAVTAGIDGINDVINNKKIDHITIPTQIEEQGAATEATNNIGDPKNLNRKGKKGKEKKISAEEMAKKEAEAIRKAEDLLTDLIEQTAEQRRAVLARQYDRQIEDVRRRLDLEKGLTVNARKALTAQIVLLEKTKEKKLAEFDSLTKEENIKREQVYIQNMLAAVKKGSSAEYDLKLQSINAAYQLELEAAQRQVMSEEDKNKLLMSITEKFYKEQEDAYKEHQKNIQEKQKKAIEDRYKEKILQEQTSDPNNSELEVLRLLVDEKKELFDNAQQQEEESTMQFNIRKLQMQKDYLDAKKDLNNAEVKADSEKWEAISNMATAASGLLEELGENNKTLARASKVLALGEIAIHTGVAIAAGIKDAQAAGPFPANLAAIASTVAAIMAGITSAIKTVKSAKFAKGGYVSGAGTETSDSIPAHLSNGESVLTASATRMFAPALSAFNQIGGGVPIVNSQSASQQIGEEFLARAVARGMAMAPRPVVSVEEINRTNNRVETIERLSTIK